MKNNGQICRTDGEIREFNAHPKAKQYRAPFDLTTTSKTSFPPLLPLRPYLALTMSGIRLDKVARVCPIT